MAMHGHTSIELTDVNTGEKKTYEDDNLVTNFLSNIMGINLQGWGLSGLETNRSNITGSTDDDLVKRLKKATHTLMLFDSEIPEDANTFIAPASTELVGIARDKTYSGSNTMVGSFNNLESGWQDTAHKVWKYVWDFNANQGNGDIACACLSTALGFASEGVCPFDSSLADTSLRSDSYVYNYINRSERMYFPTYSYLRPIRTLHFFFADYTNDTLYAPLLSYNGMRYVGSTQKGNSYLENHFINKKYLDIYKYKMYFKSWPMFSGNNSSLFSKPYDSVRVQMPSGLASICDELLSSSSYYYIHTSWGRDEKYFYMYIIPSTLNDYNKALIIPNGNAYIWKINQEDFTSTWHTFTNTTGENIYVIAKISYNSSNNATTYDHAGENFCVTDDAILTVTESGKCYQINANDNTDLTLLTMKDGTSIYNSSTSGDNFGHLVYTEGKVLLMDNSSSSNKRAYIWNTRKKRLYSLQGYFNSIWSAYNCNMIKLKGAPVPLYITDLSNDSGGRFGLAEHFAPLVTINNLQTPVTKTPSQTMKVSYTITLSDD